jgi:hypothetical protein
VDEAKIEKIKSLNGNNPQSAMQAIKAQGLLDELTLLQASSILLGLGVLQKILPGMIDATLAAPFAVTYLKQKKAIPLRDGKKRL